MTLDEIAAAVHGRLVPPAADAGVTAAAPEVGAVVVSSAVVSDSRQATPGSLYVARIGEHADGHDFAVAAAERGAVATLGLRPVGVHPTVVVADVQDAFAALGAEVLRRCRGLRIIGITGSSGKTTTKDLLAQVLRTAGETIAPVGSLNSEVGVPLTACRVTEKTRFLVAEMGASGVGHIRYLTTIAPPSIGVVLNVGSAHLGPFGSLEAIARTKSELVQALPADGVAVLNADDELVAAMAAATPAHVVSVGRGERADLRATDVSIDARGFAGFRVRGRVRTPVGDELLDAVIERLAVPGEHQIGNVLAVIAAAAAAGVPVLEAVGAASSATVLSRWRMEVHDLPDGITLVNDAYNANPESMHAALRALAAMRAGRRTVAVLGAMRELGPESDRLHATVGAQAAELGLDLVIAVGEAAPIADGVRGPGTQVRLVPDPDSAEQLLAEILTPGDVVLFKSSRDSGLRHLGDRVARAHGAVIQEGATA
ncbi:MAG: UDP-N-acetylmuramoyl-tripeptide--D-alanyl-D-alanine ligase [Nakamurella sp.]